jgi:hypothetical protein
VGDRVLGVGVAADVDGDALAALGRALLGGQSTQVLLGQPSDDPPGERASVVERCDAASRHHDMKDRGIPSSSRTARIPRRRTLPSARAAARS